MPEYTIPKVVGLPAESGGKKGRRRVVLVAIPGANPSEIIGPLGVLEEANFFLEHSGRPDLGYDIEVVSLRAGSVFKINGLKMVVEKAYHRIRGEVDTLILQAMDSDERCLEEKKFLSWLARMSGRTRRVASICIATYILAEAGILEGRRATTHWAACKDFRRRYPGVHLEDEPVYVKDGNIYTSAGATAGLDLTLALVEEDFGKELALAVAQGLVMFLKRPGNQAQFSVQMSTKFPEESRIGELQAYVTENPGRDLGVEALAKKVSMSPRNFARVFGRQVGMTPGRFVEQTRLESARRFLEQSETSVAQVAQRCGYGTTDGMRVAFDRHLGVSPREYRKRFSSAERA